MSVHLRSDTARRRRDGSLLPGGGDDERGRSVCGRMLAAAHLTRWAHLVTCRTCRASRQYREALGDSA